MMLDLLQKNYYNKIEKSNKGVIIMKYIYEPQGVCSMQMIFDIEGDTVKDLEIIGGCPGNTIGVSALVKGKKIDELIELLKGIPCGMRGTSCPDQIAIALQKYKEKYGI